jgi:hypothetical protein
MPVLHPKTALLLVAALLLPRQHTAAENLPGARATLPAKENLLYQVEWRLISAGKVRLSWSANHQAGDPGWQAGMEMESTGLVSKLFKVKNQYSSLLRSDLCAVSSKLDAHEGRKHRETTVTFDAETRKASYLEKDLTKNAVVDTKEIDIPACVHDVVGALYHLRTLSLQPGESITLPMSDGKKSVNAKVEAQQREEIKTPSGTYKTIRYEAFLFNNVLYRRNAHLYVWLTDDARRLPVQIRVRMQFTIGTITLQLEKREAS